MCRACTRETGACTDGASASLSGDGGVMCMAICQPLCYTLTGLAQVKPAGSYPMHQVMMMRLMLKFPDMSFCRSCL